MFQWQWTPSKDGNWPAHAENVRIFSFAGILWFFVYATQNVFASKLNSSGCKYVGPLFPRDDQKRVCSSRHTSDLVHDVTYTEGQTQNGGAHIRVFATLKRRFFFFLNNWTRPQICRQTAVNLVFLSLLSMRFVMLLRFNRKNGKRTHHNTRGQTLTPIRTVRNNRMVRWTCRNT